MVSEAAAGDAAASAKQTEANSRERIDPPSASAATQVLSERDLLGPSANRLVAHLHQIGRQPLSQHVFFITANYPRSGERAISAEVGWETLFTPDAISIDVSAAILRAALTQNADYLFSNCYSFAFTQRCAYGRDSITG